MNRYKIAIVSIAIVPCFDLVFWKISQYEQQFETLILVAAEMLKDLQVVGDVLGVDNSTVSGVLDQFKNALTSKNYVFKVSSYCGRENYIGVRFL